MKPIYKLSYSIIFCLALFMWSCEGPLEEEPFSQIAPENLLTSEEGVRSLLASAYGNANFWQRTRINNLGEWMTEISWQTGGGENREAVPFINFQWDASTPIFNGYYNSYYNAIRDANTLLDNIEVAQFSQGKQDLFIAEARFVRAFSYVSLHNKFGPTPLRTTTDTEEQPLELPRATEEEMRTFIEEELLAIIPDLSEPGSEPAYGRATKGAARGVLAKFYLNTKQWQKAADMAQDIIDMGYYELFPSYEDMLKVENDGNREMLWVFTTTSNGPPSPANNIMNATFPPGFASWPEKNLQFQPSWNNWASQYRLRDAFVNSFADGDLRKEPILMEYVNGAGDTVDLMNDFTDNTRSFRYFPDPNGQANFHGNDYPIVRYADILLTRAEALNELNGPNQESIDLINQVRDRAGLTGADNITLVDFPSQEALRDHILNERLWEFYYEGLRREDLIRHGKFVEQAQNRGKNAQPFHVLFPIPQPAIDSNPALQGDQNEGY